MINPTAHADAILAWMESEIGTVSRDELRQRIEQEVRDVARRAYEDALAALNESVGLRVNADTASEIVKCFRALKAGL